MFKELFNLYDPKRVGDDRSGRLISSKLVFEEKCLTWFWGVSKPDRHLISPTSAGIIPVNGRKAFIGILTNRRVIIVELDGSCLKFRERTSSIVQFDEISRTGVSKHLLSATLDMDTIDRRFRFQGVQKRAAERFDALLGSKL